MMNKTKSILWEEVQYAQLWEQRAQKDSSCTDEIGVA